MSYHRSTRVALRNATATLGVRLGRAAIRRGISVQDIAAKVGASRATVYSWFLGKNVSNAYRKPVEQLLKDITAK